jgi:hypothetical protein
MSVQDLTFEIVSTGETIYDPLTVTSGVVTQVRVTNFGDSLIDELGFYLVPSNGCWGCGQPCGLSSSDGLPRSFDLG